MLGYIRGGAVPLRITWHLFTSVRLSADFSRSWLPVAMSVCLSENLNALWRVNRATIRYRLLLLSQNWLCFVHKETNAENIQKSDLWVLPSVFQWPTLMEPAVQYFLSDCWCVCCFSVLLWPAASYIPIKRPLRQQRSQIQDYVNFSELELLSAQIITAQGQMCYSL